MQEWRKQMNAALGVARALAAQGNTQAAVNAASKAAGLAQTSAAATKAVNLRQQIYQSSPPISVTPTVPTVVVDRGPTVNTGTKNTGGGGGGGGGGAPSAPPPPPVKIPERSLINLSTEGTPASLISNLLFERLGSVEIATIARRDTVEGQNPLYSFISNLASIRVNFDPTRLITQQRRINQNFDIYTINLDEKIPDDQYLAQNNLTSFYYIDTNGDLVIEIDNLEVDEVLDLEIANSGTINLVDES